MFVVCVVIYGIVFCLALFCSWEIKEPISIVVLCLSMLVLIASDALEPEIGFIMVSIILGILSLIITYFFMKKQKNLPVSVDINLLIRQPGMIDVDIYATSINAYTVLERELDVKKAGFQ